MSKREKILLRFLEKLVRTDITFEEVKKVANILDAEILIGGKHSIHFVYRKTNTLIPIPIHGKNIGAAYVKQIAKIIEAQIKKGKLS